MKDMTEKEARAELKAAMPWAKRFTICPPRRDQWLNDSWHVESDSHPADKVPSVGGGFDVWGRGRTLRTAVRRCIAAAKKVGAAK